MSQRCNAAMAASGVASDQLWHSVASPVFTKRVGHTATAWRDKVVVFGGRSECVRRERVFLCCVAFAALTLFACSSSFHSDVLFFHAQTRSWERVLESSPLRARAWHSATLVPAGGVSLEEEVYVVGGSDAQEVFSDVHVFTPATRSWREVHAFGPALAALQRTAHAAALSPTSPRSLLLHGGCARARGTYRADLLRLNCDSGEVRAVEPIGVAPQPRGYHACLALANTLVLFGGRVDQNADKELAKGPDVAAFYDCLADKWVTARPHGLEPPTRCTAAGASLLPAAGGIASAILLHGGVGVPPKGASSRDVRRLNDTHLLRVAAGRANVFTWEAAGDAVGESGPLAPRSMHAIAAAPCSGPDGAPGWMLLMCGGYLSDTKCVADAFARWMPGGTAGMAALSALAPSQPLPPAVAQPPSQPAEPQWQSTRSKRPRETGAGAAAAAVATAATAQRRGGLELAPAAEVRALQEAVARCEAAEDEAGRLRAALDAGNARFAADAGDLARERAGRGAAERDLAAARQHGAAAEARVEGAVADAREAARGQAAASKRAAQAEAASRAAAADCERERAQAAELQRQVTQLRAEAAHCVEEERRGAAAARKALAEETERLRCARAQADAAALLAEQRQAELGTVRRDAASAAQELRGRGEDLERGLKSLERERDALLSTLRAERVELHRASADLETAKQQKEFTEGARQRAELAAHDARTALSAAKAAKATSDNIVAALQSEVRQAMARMSAAQHLVDQLSATDALAAALPAGAGGAHFYPGAGPGGDAAAAWGRP